MDASAERRTPACGALRTTGARAKLKAKRPDVIACNGYADRDKDAPISVRRGERIRMYVLNAGPSV